MRGHITKSAAEKIARVKGHPEDSGGVCKRAGVSRPGGSEVLQLRKNSPDPGLGEAMVTIVLASIVATVFGAVHLSRRNEHVVAREG